MDVFFFRVVSDFREKDEICDAEYCCDDGGALPSPSEFSNAEKRRDDETPYFDVETGDFMPKISIPLTEIFSDSS